jgi:hypothetical protein
MVPRFPTILLFTCLHSCTDKCPLHWEDLCSTLLSACLRSGSRMSPFLSCIQLKKTLSEYFLTICRNCKFYSYLFKRNMLEKKDFLKNHVSPLNQEAYLPQQAALHDCLPGLLGDGGTLELKLCTVWKKLFCSWLTRGGMAG